MTKLEAVPLLKSIVINNIQDAENYINEVKTYNIISKHLRAMHFHCIGLRARSKGKKKIYNIFMKAKRELYD